MAMTEEEKRKYRNALALAKRAEDDYKFWATGGLDAVHDIGGQGGSTRGRNITGLLDDVLNVSTDQKIAEGIPIHDKIVQSIEGPNIFEKDRTWRDKFAGRQSIQNNLWQAYPESKPRSWIDQQIFNLAHAKGMNAPENTIAGANIWADQQIDRQEASRKWSPQSPPYNPTPVIEEFETIPPGTTGAQQITDPAEYANLFAEQKNLAYYGDKPKEKYVKKAIDAGKLLWQYSTPGRVDGQFPNEWAINRLDEIEAERAANTPGTTTPSSWL